MSATSPLSGNARASHAEHDDSHSYGLAKEARVTRIHGIRPALLTFATFIEVLDSTVTNAAVPAISGSLGGSNSQGTWVISSYSVAAAIAVPLTGWLSQRIGETRLFLSAVMLFTLTSLLCGVADDFHLLVVCRALPGSARRTGSRNPAS